MRRFEVIFFLSAPSAESAVKNAERFGNAFLLRRAYGGQVGRRAHVRVRGKRPRLHRNFLVRVPPRPSVVASPREAARQRRPTPLPAILNATLFAVEPRWEIRGQTRGALRTCVPISPGLPPSPGLRGQDGGQVGRRNHITVRGKRPRLHRHILIRTHPWMPPQCDSENAPAV